MNVCRLATLEHQIDKNFICTRLKRTLIQKPYHSVFKVTLIHSQVLVNLTLTFYDAENCSETSLQTEVFRLACQHTYHEQCHIRNGRKCPRCTKILKSKLSQLTKSFNKSILTPTKSARNERQQSTQDGNDDDSDVRSTNYKDPAYYSSQAWQHYIDDTVNSFNVPQPSQCLTSSKQPSTQQPSSSQQPSTQQPSSRQQPSTQQPSSRQQPPIQQP